MRWALGSPLSIKQVDAKEFQQSYSKPQKMMLIDMLHATCQKIWKTQKWPQDWKRSILLPISKKDSTKECSDQWTIALISSCLKSCMLDFSSMQTKNCQTSTQGLEKAEEPEIKLSTFTGSYRKPGNFRKTSTFVSPTMLKPLTVWIITNCGKLLQRWEYQTILPVF